MTKEELLRIAQSYAEEFTSDAVHPAHLMKAVLHKDAGLVSFIETTLGKDYFYIQEWADVQMRLSPRAVKPKTDLDVSEESEAVFEEAENYNMRMEQPSGSLVGLLAALVTPGVGFSFDVLKTLPLTADEVVAKATLGGNASQGGPDAQGAGSTAILLTGDNIKKYCINKLGGGAQSRL